MNKEALNALIYKLMGGGGRLNDQSPENVKKCLSYYWKRRRKVSSLAELTPDDRRMSVLLLRHCKNIPIADLQQTFGKSRATIMRDLDFMEWCIMRDLCCQTEFSEIYHYLAYYTPRFY